MSSDGLGRSATPPGKSACAAATTLRDSRSNLISPHGPQTCDRCAARWLRPPDVRCIGKHLIRCLEQDVYVLGLEHEIRIKPFHHVIKARDGRAAFVARLDPDREGTAAPRRHLPQRAARSFRRLGLLPRASAGVISRLSLVDSRLGWISVTPRRHASARREAFAALAAPHSEPGLIRSG
jgi:hypothetical protein